MVWMCIKCKTRYQGNLPKHRICHICRKAPLQVNQLSLKTKDKEPSKETKLLDHGFDKVIPDVVSSEVTSWEELHPKRRNLTKKKGVVIAKQVYGRKR